MRARIRRFIPGLILGLVLVAGMMPIARAQPVRPPSRDPQAVEINFFTATSRSDHLLLEWESVSELETRGYYIWRNTADDPPSASSDAIQLKYIPAENAGSPLGAYYTYQDRFELVAGTTYWYWLQELDINGNRILIDEPYLVPSVTFAPAPSPYDVNGDWVIDAQDLAAIASHWNCAASDACYDPTYDVDADGDVDIKDIMLVAGRWGCQWGETCYG